VVPTTRLERESVSHRARAVAEEPPPPPLRALPLRCLVVQGGLDLLVPPSTALRLAAALPPGTGCHLLPLAGHVPYFTHPDACAALLQPFLADALRPRAAPLAG
jgi:pimeloyl-ACP methyl ester carboxylesterase